MTPFRYRAALFLLAASSLTGCMVGPKYHTPTAATAPVYKELAPADYKNTDGWKVAQPKDDALRGKWWEIFNDPELNDLEEKVNVSNQTIAAAAANFFASRSLVKEARAQFEHAIAMLTGQPASTFSIPVKPLIPNPPAIPIGLPSQLLERRPDIASAERLIAQANAQIGIARAAYFPTITLTGAAGLESSSITTLF